MWFQSGQFALMNLSLDCGRAWSLRKALSMSVSNFSTWCTASSTTVFAVRTHNSLIDQSAAHSFSESILVKSIIRLSRGQVGAAHGQITKLQVDENPL